MITALNQPKSLAVRSASTAVRTASADPAPPQDRLDKTDRSLSPSARWADLKKDYAAATPDSKTMAKLHAAKWGVPGGVFMALTGPITLPLIAAVSVGGVAAVAGDKAGKGLAKMMFSNPAHQEAVGRTLGGVVGGMLAVPTMFATAIGLYVAEFCIPGAPLVAQVAGGALGTGFFGFIGAEQGLIRGAELEKR